jgi:hypothetical protein
LSENQPIPPIKINIAIIPCPKYVQVEEVASVVNPVSEKEEAEVNKASI